MPLLQCFWSSEFWDRTVHEPCASLAGLWDAKAATMPELSAAATIGERIGWSPQRVNEGADRRIALIDATQHRNTPAIRSQDWLSSTGWS